MWTYLWQNFLIDAKIRHYIADHIFVLYKDLWCDTLIEIWPGKWSITKLIFDISKNFFVIEKDESLVEKLKSSTTTWSPSFIKEDNPGWFIQWDILDINVEKILKEKKLESEKTLLVWNLPYYITSPILRKFFGEGKQDFAWGIFMVQDEVAQRLDVGVNKKSYLRWLLNYAYEVKYLKWVSAKCFRPVPKVKSALISLNVKHEIVNVKFESLIQFLDLYSAYSRKTLGAIEKMIEKKRQIPPTPLYQWGPFQIPEELRGKRLEELGRKELEEILN